MTILEADALSLDADGEGDAPRLLPVRHRAGEANLPLLPEDRQHSFSLDQFHRWPTARAVYSLPGGVYVVLSPPRVQRMGTTSVIWFGCTSYCCANSVSVFSPLIAASATLALKGGVWVRRVRFVVLAPDPRHPRRSQAVFPPVGLSEFGRPPPRCCHADFATKLWPAGM
jgi:hypothetical protein